MMAIITPTVRSSLYHLSLHITKHPGASEMLLADTITKAISRVDLVRAGKFVAYLRAILRNASFDWMKRFKRAQRYLDFKHDTSTRSAFAEAISREALKVFDEAVSKLTRRQRRVVILRVVDSMSYDDIGKKMKISAQAARVLFFRAKDHLKQLLEYGT